MIRTTMSAEGDVRASRSLIGSVPAFSAALVASIIGLAVLAAFAGRRAGYDSATKTAPEQSKFQVHGRVVMRSDGRPVTNVDVRLVAWRNNDTRYDAKKTLTDTNGEFVFDKVTAGKVRLVAFFEGYASRQAMYKGQPVDLSKPNPEPITLTLDKMPSIDVQVVAKADAKPLAKALVKLVWTDGTGHSRHRVEFHPDHTDKTRLMQRAKFNLRCHRS